MGGFFSLLTNQSNETSYQKDASISLPDEEVSRQIEEALQDEELEIPFKAVEEYNIPQIVPFTSISEDQELLREKLKELGF